MYALPKAEPSHKGKLTASKFSATVCVIGVVILPYTINSKREKPQENMKRTRCQGRDALIGHKRAGSSLKMEIISEAGA